MSLAPTSFETFVADVNRWLAPGLPATRDEALDARAQGCRLDQAWLAAQHIERRRAQSARRSRLSVVGDAAAAAIITIGGPIVAGILSLFPDEAEAATVLVATREGVLSVGLVAALCGIVIGLIVGWMTAPRVHREDAAFRDHPDVARVVEISSRRVRS